MVWRYHELIIKKHGFPCIINSRSFYTSQISQSRLAFLLGAGCSKKAELSLIPQLTDEVIGHERIGKKTKSLLGEHVGSGETPCYAELNEPLVKHSSAE